MSIFLRDGGRRGEAGWIWECSAFLRVGWKKKRVEESAAHWIHFPGPFLSVLFLVHI